MVKKCHTYLNKPAAKMFRFGPSKICGRQPLKNSKGYGLPKADDSYDLWLLPSKALMLKDILWPANKFNY